MTITTRIMTVEELEQAHVPDGLWEVIDGELVEVTGAGGEHTTVALTIILRLGNFVTPRRLGTVLLPDSGIVLGEAPLVMRLPDTGFIRADRLPLD
ncbi:MAG: Uma2 family endonuclease [Chloroflexia bacterium]|nr:Uma2 family endonuclease [Chloroflexia bacterium]